MSDWNHLRRREFLKQLSATGAAVAAAGIAIQPAVANDDKTPGQQRKIRVGGIGCGNVSGAYLPNLLASPFVEVVSVCDIIPERAEAAAKKYKVPNFYPHIDKMLAGADFDLLVNLTSMPAHFPLNKAALQAGKHVWTEKPMASSVGDGKKLLALAKQRNLGFWGAPTCVTSPQFRFMAETLAGGKLGRVCAAHASYGHLGPTWSAWFFQKGGGCLYDLGVYNIMTLTAVCGDTDTHPLGNCFNPNGDEFTPSDIDTAWGDGECEWVTFAVCSQVRLETPGDPQATDNAIKWIKKMPKVHALIGYRQSAPGSGTDVLIAADFVKYLHGIGGKAHKTVVDAWMQANLDREATYATALVQKECVTDQCKTLSAFPTAETGETKYIYYYITGTTVMTQEITLPE